MWTLPKFALAQFKSQFNFSSLDLFHGQWHLPGHLPRSLTGGVVAIATALLAQPAIVQAQAAQTVELDRNGAVRAIPFERTQSTISSYTYFHGQFPGGAYPVIIYPQGSYPQYPQIGQSGFPPDNINHQYPVNYPVNYLVNYPGNYSGGVPGVILITPQGVRPHSFPAPIVQYRYPVRHQITFPTRYRPHSHR
jgi:hypothetical protein